VAAERVTNLLGAFALAVTDAVRQAGASAAGHTDAMPAALTILLSSPRGRSIDELSRAVALTPSGGVRLVDRMVGAGFVERRPGADARSVRVVLTRRGRGVARSILTARNAVIERLLEPLDREQRSRLETMLESLLGAHATQRIDARRRRQEPPGGWMCRLCDQVACGRDHDDCPAANAAATALADGPD
jgi:DNA-binding MarR family transcriptional regulator